MVPSWSADGKYVAFRATTSDSLCYKVFIFDLEAKSIKEIDIGQQACGISDLYWTRLSN
jgi:Tol biopolymer transport system component